MNMEARLIKTIPNKTHGGEMRLYKVKPLVEFRGETTDHLMVSAIPLAFDTGRPETYIFPANSAGEIISWGELEGSFRGGMDHEKALRDAGYEIKDGE